MLLRQIDVALVSNEELADMDCWLMVDLLAGFKPNSHLFFSWRRGLLPVVTVQEALDLKKKMGEDWILMGEMEFRLLVLIWGTPSLLKQKGLGGKTKGIICTSNGTQALLKAEQYGRNVVVASALNASYACDAAMEMGGCRDPLCG